MIGEQQRRSVLYASVDSMVVDKHLCVVVSNVFFCTLHSKYKELVTDKVDLSAKRLTFPLPGIEGDFMVLPTTEEFPVANALAGGLIAID